MTEETESKVLSIVADIVQSQKNQTETSEEVNNEVIPKKSKTKKLVPVPAAIKGKPKSGRFWKSEKEKFSSINKTKGLRHSFDKKNELRQELKRTRELSKKLREEFKQKQIEKKERRRENIKKAEENRRKAEVVQVITNTAKLKRMRKKQMRFIEKRDTNKAVEAIK